MKLDCSALQRSRPLDCIFEPNNVALIGATDRARSVGETILKNLLRTKGNRGIFAVNPKRIEINGLRAYPKIGALPTLPDLALIVTPAATVPDIIEECVSVGVKGAIIISAGFRETGAAGRELENRIQEIARGKMRIIGPNCLGVMNPINGLNATFASATALPGSVGFISQSGALCTAILDWSFKKNVGFSAFVSTGSMLDVGWGDLIYHLGDDPQTKSIVIYMESIGDARSFMSAAREIALTKPIIVIKAGRTAAAAKAAASHTGALTGSDDVLDAAFRRCGVLRVNTIRELFDLAEVLAKQPRPKGPRLTIVTNAGGPGVLATDALITHGGELANLSPQTLQQLDARLRPCWSHGNPVDVLGDASPERYSQAFEAVVDEPNSDGLLVILTPQAMTDPEKTAAHICRAAARVDKPILASWMGGDTVEAGRVHFKAADIPVFSYPDSAAKVFQLMWQYSANLSLLHKASQSIRFEPSVGDRNARAESMIRNISNSGRTLLTEIESKEVLLSYGIPTVPTRLAQTADEAVALAKSVGFPVVLKLHSHTLTHKSDVGGVELNLIDVNNVREAYERIAVSVREKAGAEHFDGVTVQPMVSFNGYELIIGACVDAQFGPIVMIGAGGQLVEVLNDRALALPPLTAALARQLIERTKISVALKGTRGRPAVDLDALDQILVRFSELVAEQRRIKEIDINPLLVSTGKLIALDARVILHEASVPDSELPRVAVEP